MDSSNHKEQQERLMNGRKANGTTNGRSGLRAIINVEKGTFLGRTPSSWFKILTFYAIFYLLLASFWSLCLFIFISTLDPTVPRYYGKGTIIGVNPGVGYQPWVPSNPDSTLIKFNVNDAKSYKDYTAALKENFKKYGNITGTRVCSGDQSNSDLVKDGSPKADLTNGNVPMACRFDLKVFDQSECGEADDYGFKHGQPCVFLYLNRLIGWKPIDFADNSVPELLESRYEPGSVTFHCDGTNSFDKEHIGELVYVPKLGLDGRYYPYVVLPNYHQPVAAVKFVNTTRNQVVLVECRAYAQNIEHDITAKVGLVNFEILIEDKKPEDEKKVR